MKIRAQANTETELSDKLVKDVGVFVKLGRALEKEENMLHNFQRDEEKLTALQVKRDKLLGKLEKMAARIEVEEEEGGE